MTRDIPCRRELTLDEYYTGVRDCDITILPRALTLIESNNPQHQMQAETLLTRLMPYTGRSIRVGITGAPGAGKSTFIEAVGMHLVDRGKRVAVLAVDPSSGISGGSILGDKTRMTRLSGELNAFIRPSASAPSNRRVRWCITKKTRPFIRVQSRLDVCLRARSGLPIPVNRQKSPGSGAD